MTSPITSLLPGIMLIPVMTLILQRKHLLMALLCLEAFILSAITLLVLSTAKIAPTNASSMFILLTFGAAEASLGLATLVVLIRFKGSDLLKTTTSMKC